MTANELGHGRRGPATAPICDGEPPAH